MAYFWSLWKHWNEKLHKGKIKSDKEIANLVQHLAINWIKVRKKFGSAFIWDDWISSAISLIRNLYSLAHRWFFCGYKILPFVVKKNNETYKKTLLESYM